MSSHDLAPDLSRGLEVKQPPPAPGQAPAASAGADAGAGDAGAGDHDDRSALNRASEARKLARKQAERMDNLELELQQQRQLNQELVQRILGQQNGNQRTADPDPPHSADALTTLLEAGKYSEYHQAMSENHEWQRHREREELGAETDKRLEGHDRSLRMRSQLMTDLGLGSNNEVTKAIDREAKAIMQAYPNLDADTATVWASGKVWRRVATEDEYEDLRTATVERTVQAGGTQTGAAGAPDRVTIDWDAPNRGLSPDIAARFQAMGLGKVLQPSQNAAEEARHRHVIEDIVPQLEATSRRRKVMGIA